MTTVACSDPHVDWFSGSDGVCKLLVTTSHEDVGYDLVALVPNAGRDQALLEFYQGDATIQVPAAVLQRLLEAIPELLEWQRRVDQGQ